MKRILFVLLAWTLTACNLQTAPASAGESATSAALTAQAELAFLTPLPTSTLSPPTASLTPQATQPPSASVGEVVNCRSGPGTNYDRLAQLIPGESVEIVGFLPSNYWIVKTANGECWVSAEFVTPSGNFGKAPRVTPPATPEGGAPKAPSFSKNGWAWFCYGSGETDIELNWNDNADNETGYRVYRNNELIGELSANSTYFKETTPYVPGAGLQYKVEAFNEVGTSNANTEILFCN